MEKMSKINSDEFKKVLQDNYQDIVTVSWNGLEIQIKKVLSLQEMFTFVNNVTNMCFEDETGEYLPEIRDFAIKSCILDMYTNIELTDNVQQRYELIYQSDIVRFVIDNINVGQISEITHAIDIKLTHLAKANIEAINKQVNDLYNAFNNLEHQIENTFSSFSTEDVSKLLSAFTDGSIDEEKLMQAYLSQNKKDGKIIEMPKGKE